MVYTHFSTSFKPTSQTFCSSLPRLLRPARTGAASALLNPGRGRGLDKHAAGFYSPAAAAMACDVHRQFEPAPDAQLVEGAAQVILYHLLGRACQVADLAVGQPLPDQGGDLDFFAGEAIARSHDFNPTFSNAAVASLTRLRPSRIPARRNNVRKCCFTVRGLIRNWPAISLLLQP